MHPLIGRTIRLEGTDRGTEGIVLDVSVNGSRIHLVIERTKHSMLPPELDGYRPIVFVLIDARRGDQIFALPLKPPDQQAAELRRLVRSYFDASRAWNMARRSLVPLGEPNFERDAARAVLDRVFMELQEAIRPDRIERPDPEDK